MFKNRQEAGKELAKKLASYRALADHVVIGLARGGVVVAKEVALALDLPLDVLAPRKIGSPMNPEFALGAILEEEVLLDAKIVAGLGIAQKEIQRVIQEETKEMQRRESLYRKGRKRCDFQDKTVLLVDDGIATGKTLEVCIQFLKKRKSKSIIIAAPVAHPDVVLRLEKFADQVVCLLAPEDFFAVSQFYEQFEQVGDEEVCHLLKSQ